MPALFGRRFPKFGYHRESVRVHHRCYRKAGIVPSPIDLHEFDLLLLSIFISKAKMLGNISRVAKKSLAATPPALHLHRPALQLQKRFLNVHEYISMELMASHGIQVPECHVAETAQEVEHIFNTSFHHKRT
jgi:hypothetical protein